MEGKQHADVVAAIKAGGDETKLLVVGMLADEFFKKCRVLPSEAYLAGGSGAIPGAGCGVSPCAGTGDWLAPSCLACSWHVAVGCVLGRVYGSAGYTLTGLMAQGVNRGCVGVLHSAPALARPWLPPYLCCWQDAALTGHPRAVVPMGVDVHGPGVSLPPT